MNKKKSNKQILLYLTDYLILTLNELKDSKDSSEFNLGEFWAYVECLEILSKWSGFKRYRIDDIEEHFSCK